VAHHRTKHALNSRRWLGCSRIHENWSCEHNATLPDTEHTQSALLRSAQQMATLLVPHSLVICAHRVYFLVDTKSRKTHGRTVYSRLFIVIYWIFVIAGSVFRMYLWNCRSGNNEFSFQLQLLRPRLIGHWTFLCLSKGPLCRLKGYKLWSTERKNKAHWGRSNVPEWLLSCSLLPTGSRGGMKSRNKSSYI